MFLVLFSVKKVYITKQIKIYSSFGKMNVELKQEKHTQTSGIILVIYMDYYTSPQHSFPCLKIGSEFLSKLEKNEWYLPYFMFDTFFHCEHMTFCIRVFNCHFLHGVFFFAVVLVARDVISRRYDTFLN